MLKIKKIILLFIPISVLFACGADKEAVDVYINTEIDENEREGQLYIKGETNLPHHASLSYNIEGTGDNEYSGSAVGNVYDGEFEPVPFSDGGELLERGLYELKIYLPNPSIQSPDFVKKAGEDYEYLKGDLMTKNDVGQPIMVYESEFTLE